MDCPHCRAGLRTPGTLPGDLKCPRCGHKVTFARAAGRAPVAQPAGRPVPKRRHDAPPSQRRWWFAVLMIAGAGTVAAALLVGALSWNVDRETPAPAVVAAAPSAQPAVAAPQPPPAPEKLVAPAYQPAAVKPASAPIVLAAHKPSLPMSEPMPEPMPEVEKVVVAVEPAPAAQQPAPANVQAVKQFPKARPAELKIVVPPQQQTQINQAVAKGVAFLKQSLRGDSGRDDEGYSVGRTALAGLTLLECGVRGDDPAVTRAATVVRAATPSLRDTYSLALAILFLDRLGQPQDSKRIQTFAARLVAGQNGRGGWSYYCPWLSTPDEEVLLTMLRDAPPLQAILPRPKPPLHTPLTNPTDLTRGTGLPSDGSLRQPLSSGSLPKPLAEERPLQRGVTEPLTLLNPVRSVKKDGLQLPRRDPAPKFQNPIDPNARERMPAPVRPPMPVPAALRNIPALNVSPDKDVKLLDKDGPEDHSNTQFAILGLWAARRHGVPMDRTLVLIERRFRAAQNADGSWGYHFGDHKQADSMTCAGLLGMALALGVDMQLQGEAAGPGLANPAVKKGFAYLAASIGRTAQLANPNVKGKGKGKEKTGRLVGADSRGDLYYLWSVERVAVAYRQPTIGGKDWYRWGAAAILPSQWPDGAWRERHAGIPDTSFALLFLTRANPVRDLPQLAGP